MSREFKLEKGSLDDLTPKNIDPKAIYLINWSKIEKVEDMIMIFAAMGISFGGTHPMIQAVAKFLDLDKPIYPNEQQQPQQGELTLPKLKPVN